MGPTLAAISVCVCLASCGSPAAPETSPSATPTPSASPGPAGPPATADDWPFFRGDAGHSGKGGAGPVGQPEVKWRYQAGGSVNNTVAIVGDLVYATSDDDVLHALEIGTGTERWRFNPPNPPVSAPAVADGVVYAFDGVGTLFALDAVTGGIRWHTADTLQSPSSLTVGDGLIYVGTAAGALVALDVKSGAQRWLYPYSTSAGAVHDPGFADGIVYAGSDSGGFAAVDAATGSLLWRFDMGPSSATAVVADGVAYIGDHLDTGPVPGHRYALDARTGNLLWQLDLQRNSPAVSDGVAYSGSGTGLIMAHATATGHELWQFQVQGATSGMAVAGGVLYVAADGEHRIYALDGASGSQLWSSPFDLDGGVSCCVAVAHGSVFVGTDAGSIYRIDGDGTTIPVGSGPPPPPSPTASPSAPPTATAAAFPPPVEFVWSARAGPSGMDFPGDMALDPQGRLWVADTGNSRFAIFEPDGKFVEYWEHRGTGDGQFILERSNGDGYGAIEFAPDGSFYVLDVGNRRVEHFAEDRKFIKWWGGFGTTPGTYTDPIGLAVDARGVVYVLDDARGVIEWYDNDGDVLGSIDNNPSRPAGLNTANSLSLDGQGNFYVSDCCAAGNQVEKLDRSGTLLATFGAAGSGPGDFTDQPGSMGIDAAGRLFVGQGPIGTSNRIEIFASDASFLAGFASPGFGDGQVAFASGIILDGSGYVYVGDAATNRIQKFRLLPPFAP